MKTIKQTLHQLKLLCLLISLTVIPIQGISQTMHFDVFLYGDKIGDMKVTREEKPGGIELYSLTSYSKAKVVWVTKVDTTLYKVTYKDGILISSNYKETENGELKNWTNITKSGNTYNVDGNKGKSTFTETPTCSVLTSYFKDVSNTKRLFYESEAYYTNVEHPDLNTCSFESSEGTESVFHFANGKIQSTEFKVSVMATVKVVRID